MLRNLWGKLTGTGVEARKHEEELEEMSPDERHFASESVEDVAADNLADQLLGGVDAPSLRNHEDPPPLG